MWLTLLGRLWPYILGAIVLLAVEWYIYDKGYDSGLSDGREEKRIALQELEKGLIERCQKEKDLSYEVSDAYQKNLTNVDDMLSAVKLRREQRKVPVANNNTESTGRYHAETERREPDRGNGKDSRFLEFGAQCERDRQQVLALQDYIRKALEAVNKP